MAFEWVAGLFQSEQTRGLSGDTAHNVALDDANPYYNYRLRRHKAEGDLVENHGLLWYTSPYVKRRAGLGTHVSAEVGEGVANYTDVLLILSEEDHARTDASWVDEATRVLQQEFETFCRREGFSRLHAHRPVGFRILRDGSDEVGGQQLGLAAGEFVTGLLPNLYTGAVRGSFPVIGVNVNLPGVWEGYQEVGRLYNDQILFTLGSHWLDNFRHPSLEQAALYRLRQYPDGSFVHIINPDLQDQYQVTTANQGGASVLTLATRAGKPLAYIVLAVIDPPSTRPSTAPAAEAPPPRPSAPPGSDTRRGPPVPSIAPPMMLDEGDGPRPALEGGLGGKTIIPDAPAERIFTLQERGALLQKVHFSAFMLGYDVYLGKRGELGTHVDDPAATFQVRKRSVSLVAHIDGVKVGGRPVPTDVEVPVEGDMGIEFAGQRLEYRDLRALKVEGWPYVGEIRRPASSTYMIWGEDYRIGRSRECRVVLPDEPRNDNISWKPSVADGATIRARTGEIPKSRFYTDSIMVASEHATIDLRKGLPEVICTARHCYVYVRRGESVEALHPTSSGRQPQASFLEPGDEVLIGNCLFHVGFTPASEAAATAPAPKVELRPVDDLADAVSAPRIGELDRQSAETERHPRAEPPSIAPPAIFDDDEESEPTITSRKVASPPPAPPPPPVTAPPPPPGAFPPPPPVLAEPEPMVAVPPPLPSEAPDPGDVPLSEPPPLPLVSGPDSLIADLEEVEDDPTIPGVVIPSDDPDAPIYELPSAVAEITADHPPPADVGGWDQDWDDEVASEPGAPPAPVEREGSASVSTPFPDLSDEGAAPHPVDDEPHGVPDLPAPEPTMELPRDPMELEPTEGHEPLPAELLAAERAATVVSEPPPAPVPPAPPPAAPPASPPAAPSAPVVAGASGEVVFMDDQEAQFELGRPMHLVQSGWMINGEVTVGNHRGADLVIPENRIVEDQVFVARDYFRLKVRGKRGTLTVCSPTELLIDEGDPALESYDDPEKHVIDVIRRDDQGDEDFAVRLVLREEKALPDPRARLLAIDVDDPLAAALTTRGLPKGAPRTLTLGEITLTLHFDGAATVVSDYLDSYRTADGFRPFFVQQGGGRFVTAPEDGQPFQLSESDRLVVGHSVFVLRQE